MLHSSVMSVLEMISEVISAFDQENFSVSESRSHKDFAGEFFSLGVVHEFIESLVRLLSSVEVAVRGWESTPPCV